MANSSNELLSNRFHGALSAFDVPRRSAAAGRLSCALIEAREHD
jgi:hypothetical protein